MTDMLAERTVICPTCWEPSTYVLDLTASAQTFIEDCQVCCNPMTITIAVEDGELVSLEADTA